MRSRNDSEFGGIEDDLTIYWFYTISSESVLNVGYYRMWDYTSHIVLLFLSFLQRPSKDYTNHIPNISLNRGYN